MEEKIKDLIKELENDIEKYRIQAEEISHKIVKVHLIVLQLKEMLEH